MINKLNIYKEGLLFTMVVKDDEGNESNIYARNKSDLNQYYNYFKS